MDNNNLGKILKKIESVLDTTGIYPASVVGGDKPYKKRDDYKNGWNACAMEMTDQISKALAEAWKESEQDLTMLLLADVINDDHGHYVLDMNDTFYYACADGEEVKPEEIKEVARLFRWYGFPGLNYWVAGKRGHDPEIPQHREEVEYVRGKEKKEPTEPETRLIHESEHESCSKDQCVKDKRLFYKILRFFGLRKGKGC